ncbi:MAG: cell surface protein [bacterium]
MSRWFVAGVLLLTACADDEPSLPYASAVVSFTPGDGAGYGQSEMPGIVLGPPVSKGPSSGSLDVLSLGVGGEIILDLGVTVVDGPGADIIVFENAFTPRSAPDTVFAEYGEVAVSLDGDTWSVFACNPPDDTETCAGWHPVNAFDPEDVIPLDPSVTGGDPFDLSALGVEKTRFLRIRDKSDAGVAPSAGFDLDAVGFVQ